MTISFKVFLERKVFKLQEQLITALLSSGNLLCNELKFRFLIRLLLIHGRNSYRRISKLILYSFYKNILLYFTQFWFVFFSGFSGQVTQCTLVLNKFIIEFI